MAHYINSSSEQKMINGLNSPLSNMGIDIEDITCNVKNSEMQNLFSLLKDIHFEKLKAIEKDDNLSKTEKSEEKLSILEKYVHQLQEQNDTFMSTMIELEKEASERVAQMNKRLNSSAKSTMEAVINVHECEGVMKQLLNDRLYIESFYSDVQSNFDEMKVENSFLRDQNFNLNHDIQALLHVIQCARSTGNWEMGCVTFCDVTPEQVFGPVQSISNIYKSSSSHLEFDPHEQFNKLLKKENKIKMLEYHIKKLKQKLSAKEAACECHLWKYGQVIQKKQGRGLFSPPIQHSKDTPLTKCISLPDIGNIYSYTPFQKSFSLKEITGDDNMKINFPIKKHFLSRYDTRDTLHQNYKFVNKLKSYPLYVRRGQSEPHLFMFGDNIYVYRPCEPVEKTSNIFLNYSDFVLPCQSIDLKFPTEESTHGWDWSFTAKNEANMMFDFSNHEELPSSSCSSSNIENLGLHVELSNKKVTNKSSSTQTEHFSKQTIGLQTLINVEYLNEMNDNCNHQINKLEMMDALKILKGNLVKTENKVEEKDILIEQLHGHVTTVLKEVELKDEVLQNIEKKLKMSRNKCSSLQEENATMNDKMNNILSDLKNSQILCHHLQEKIEQQNHIIRNLQDALVKSKRALDATKTSSFHVRSIASDKNSSRSSIVDI